MRPAFLIVNGIMSRLNDTAKIWWMLSDMAKVGCVA